MALFGKLGFKSLMFYIKLGGFRLLCSGEKHLFCSAFMPVVSLLRGSGMRDQREHKRWNMLLELKSVS